MWKNSKLKLVRAFVALTAFAWWLLAAHRDDVTMLLVPLMYLALLGYYLSGPKASSGEKSSERSTSAAAMPSTGKQKARPEAKPDDKSSFRSASEKPRQAGRLMDEFVDIPIGDEPAPRFSIRPRPAKPSRVAKLNADECWVPRQVAVKVGRYRISSGLFYFGEGLESASGAGTEPSLIDESLPVGRADDFRVRQLPYYPTYASASEDGRAAYLNWLANGRRDSSADIGYVYLYFYGLERRAFVDASNSTLAQAELPLVCAEVEALLSTYSHNASFARRAHNFLASLKAVDVNNETYLDTPPKFPLDTGPNFLQRVALSQAYSDDRPFPVQWLLSWYFTDRQFSKPPAVARNLQYFEKLFTLETARQFPGSARSWVNAQRAPKLSLTYQPVYPGLQSTALATPTSLDMLDVTSSLSGLGKVLEAICQGVARELEAFTDFVGKSAEKAKMPEAVLLLPISLWPADIAVKFGELVAWIKEKGPVSAPIPLSWLFAPLELPEKLDRAHYAQLLARIESAVQLQVEPDPRFGTPLPARDTEVIFFVASSHSPAEASDSYVKCAVAVWFYAAVIQADGSVHAQKRLRALQFVYGAAGLSEPERTRLQALFTYYLNSPVSMYGMKKRVIPLDDGDRKRLSEELIEVCQADGGLANVANIRVLEKLFEALGQDAKRLYSMAHSGAAMQESVDAGETSTAAAGRHATDTLAASTGKRNFALDMERIARLRAETAQVGAMLGAIFGEEAEERGPEFRASRPDSPSASTDGSSELSTGVNVPLLGLDAKHSALLRRLLVKAEGT